MKESERKVARVEAMEGTNRWRATLAITVSPAPAPRPCPPPLSPCPLSRDPRKALHDLPALLAFPSCPAFKYVRSPQRPSRADQGEYKCSVKNKWGSDHTTFNLG